MRWSFIMVDQINWYVDCAAGQNVISNAHKVNWPDTRKFIYHSNINCMNSRASETEIVYFYLLWTIGKYRFLVLRVWVLILFGGFPKRWRQTMDFHVTEMWAGQRDHFRIMTFLWTLNWKWNANSCLIQTIIHACGDSHLWSNSKYAWECIHWIQFIVYCQPNLCTIEYFCGRLK